MKTIISIIFLMILTNTVCFSQLPQSYPYKAISDNSGNIYVAGDTLNPATNTLDFVVKKIVNGVQVWTRPINYPFGDDKGMDVVFYHDNEYTFIYATGYIKNQNGKREILTVKLESELGDTIWTRRYGAVEDCKGLAIALDIEGNPYVTGYKTQGDDKDILILKYSSGLGTLQWYRIYDNPVFYKNDDVGTDILADLGHVYIMGYTYGGNNNLDDIILLNYDLNGGNEEVNIFSHPQNQLPTSFVFAHFSGNTLEKSRIALTSVSDNTSYHLAGSDYLTLYFAGGMRLRLVWANFFRRADGTENVATSIDADMSGNLYVTGYSKSLVSGYDYATMKYLPSGQYGWQDRDSIKYFDMENGDDKASSVKTFDNKIYVTGSSQLFPGGYRTLSYEQGLTGNVELSWEGVFRPSFFEDGSGENLTYKASTLVIDHLGIVNVMTMKWGENIASRYALRGYEAAGRIIYTLDDMPEGENYLQTKAPISKTKENTFTLSQNYPNPFNPETIIRYDIKTSGNVSIRVYDLSGKEVAKLTDELHQAGSHSVTFNGMNLPSGIYYYKLVVSGANPIKTDEFEDVRKMVMVK